MKRKKQLAGRKFMMVLHPKVEDDLRKHAEDSGIHLQELIRGRIIPDWLYGPPVVSKRTIEQLRKKGLLKTERKTTG
jgi:hypothetical protein